LTAPFCRSPGSPSSANLYGSIGNASGASAAHAIDSSLENPPYFINGVAWSSLRPTSDPVVVPSQVAQIAAITAPKSTVPNTPEAAALSTRAVSSTYSDDGDELSAVLDSTAP